MDWFEKLTGFRELGYDETQRKLEVAGDRLRSSVNGRSYGIGTLETPSLGELRARAAAVAAGLRGRLSVSNVSGDVRKLHATPGNANVLFQVASQFNLLEMTSDRICPEDGVTRYQDDHTQGPACAIAAGAATLYRHYFAPIDGQIGQTRRRRIDCLQDIGTALGNEDESLWEMRNGYAMCSEEGLAKIQATLEALDAPGRDALRDRLRIGLHWDVEVTDMPGATHRVSQAFCSALPIAYANHSAPSQRWQPFATLVLEGTYEATLWAAVLNAHRHGCRTVFLTRVGGSAFGNEKAWIHDAMRRALRTVSAIGLDVRIVSYDRPDNALVDLAHEFR